MRTRMLLSGISLLLSASCVLRVGSGAALVSPAGSRVTLSMESGSRLSGELLEARDSALVVLADRQVTFVRVAGVDAVEVPGTDIHFNRRPRLGALLRDLQLESRYPQGITEALMARLLAEAHQLSLVVRD